MAWRGLTKQQWETIRIHLPPPKASPRGGRPRLDDCRCLEGILWILWTGAPWSELPRRYGRPSTAGAGSRGGKRPGYSSSAGGPS
jgi:transposase